MTQTQQVADLSAIHHPITSLFTSPETKEAWDQYRLTKDQVDFFRENGYLNDIRLLNNDQVQTLISDLNEISRSDHPGNDLFYEFHSNESTSTDKILFHALGAWRVSEAFHDVLWNPAFLVAASQLLGNKSVRFWHDQLFCKPALHGGVVAWHQDYSYWTRTGPIQHLTCWVGLDDTSVENGCMFYIPKSHNWGLLDKPELAGDMEGVMNYLTEDQKREFKPVPIEMKAGYGSFHHPLLVHGSYENKSNRARRAFVLNVFADGTESNSDDEMLQGVPPVKKGNKMEGRFFPLLFKA